jgi:hypothetical protein
LAGRVWAGRTTKRSGYGLKDEVEKRVTLRLFVLGVTITFHRDTSSAAFLAFLDSLICAYRVLRISLTMRIEEP